LTLGYSPCPNDTFIFHGIAEGGLALKGIEIETVLHDVETLNAMAMTAGQLDVTKLSFYAYLAVRNRYRLLNSGAALGYGCGPVVIARKPLTRKDMTGCRIVLPGRWTTAHLLFRLWAPEAANRVFVTYDKIFQALDKGEADCGVIIHESRFTFEGAGFRPVKDLGAFWEEKTGLPIPLGCIAARRSLGRETAGELDALIRKSILAAREQPQRTLPYIRRHAQEISAPILQQHIDTFVNAFTLDLGEKGRAAVTKLEELALGAGVLS
jgi:1,4-dihydroxy-6-naphthoate synthase